MPFLRVALDLPIPELFDYRLPEGAGDAQAWLGRRVLVPFGRKTLVGVVLEIAEHSAIDPARVKTARDVLRDTPALPGSWLTLLRFCAGYYQHPLGAAVLAALPAKFKMPPRFRSAALDPPGLDRRTDRGSGTGTGQSHARRNPGAGAALRLRAGRRQPQGAALPRRVAAQRPAGARARARCWKWRSRANSIRNSAPRPTR